MEPRGCWAVAHGSYKRAMNCGMDAEGNGYRRYVTTAAITTALGVNTLQWMENNIGRYSSSLNWQMK